MSELQRNWAYLARRAALVSRSHELRNSWVVLDLLLVEPCQVEIDASDAMLGPQYLLIDSEYSLQEQLGLLVLAPVSVEPCQVVAGGYRVGVLKAQHALADHQGALVEWLSLSVLALFLVKPGQLMQRSGCVGVIWTQCLFANG